jgi:hypothetical protein
MRNNVRVKRIASTSQGEMVNFWDTLPESPNTVPQVSLGADFKTEYVTYQQRYMYSS